jgi:hypothetical protein
MVESVRSRADFEGRGWEGGRGGYGDAESDNSHTDGTDALTLSRLEVLNERILGPHLRANLCPFMSVFIKHDYVPSLPPAPPIPLPTLSPIPLAILWSPGFAAASYKKFTASLLALIHSPLKPM